MVHDWKDNGREAEVGRLLGSRPFERQREREKGKRGRERNTNKRGGERMSYRISETQSHAVWLSSLSATVYYYGNCFCS